MGPLADMYQNSYNSSPSKSEAAQRFAVGVKWVDQHSQTNTPKKSLSKSPYKVSPKGGAVNNLAQFMPDGDLIQRAKSIKITHHYRMENSNLKSAIKKKSLIASQNSTIVIDNSEVVRLMEEDDQATRVPQQQGSKPSDRSKTGVGLGTIDDEQDDSQIEQPLDDISVKISANYTQHLSRSSDKQQTPQENNSSKSGKNQKSKKDQRKKIKSTPKIEPSKDDITPRRHSHHQAQDRNQNQQQPQLTSGLYQMYGSAATQQRAQGITNIINNHNINNIYIQTPQIDIASSGTALPDSHGRLKSSKQSSDIPQANIRKKQLQQQQQYQYYQNNPHKQKINVSSSNRGGGSLGAMKRQSNNNNKRKLQTSSTSQNRGSLPIWKSGAESAIRMKSSVPQFGRPVLPSSSQPSKKSQPVKAMVDFVPGSINISSGHSNPYRAHHQQPPVKSVRSTAAAAGGNSYKPVYQQQQKYYPQQAYTDFSGVGIFQNAGQSRGGVIINNFTGDGSSNQQGRVQHIPSHGGPPKPLKATQYDFLKKISKNQAQNYDAKGYSFSLGLKQKPKKQRPSTAPTKRPPSPGRGQQARQTAQAPGLIERKPNIPGTNISGASMDHHHQHYNNNLHYHQQVTGSLSHSINIKHQSYQQGFGSHLQHHRGSSSKPRHISPAVGTGGGSASASAITTLRGIAPPVKSSWKI